VLKKVWNTVSVVLVCMIALLLVGVRLVGLQPYAVLSGSMSPAYPVGALIYVKKAAPQEIRVGDPITFHLSGASTVATHRVVKIDAQNECFYTKGDANETPDGAPVYYDQLIGMPVFSIPALGYISVFVATPPGLLIAAATLLALILLTILPGLIKKAERQESSRRPGRLQKQKECACAKAKSA